jgi:hypothetical protein
LKAGEWFRRGRLIMVSPVHGDYRRCQAEIPLIILCRFPGPALRTPAMSVRTPTFTLPPLRFAAPPAVCAAAGAAEIASARHMAADK